MALDPIIVKIQADHEQFRKELNDAKVTLRQFGKEVESTSKVSGGLTDRFNMMKAKVTIAAAAITGAAYALNAWTEATKDAILKTSAWSKTLGVSLQTFSALEKVARTNGATTEDLGNAMRTLSERVFKASTGNEQFEKTLNMIGLKSRELIYLSIDEQFLAVAKALENTNDVGKRNAAITELMSGAKQLI
jgi:hypothetical protein